MTRRLSLVLLCLLLCAALATPAVAQRRRAVTPGFLDRCSVSAGPVASEATPFSLTQDDRFIYWYDEFTGLLHRVPKGGGEVVLLGDAGDWIPLAMTVDDASLYIAAIPTEALFTPMPGSILKMSKSGGVLHTIVSGVMFPTDIETDATHVYWVDAGTYDFLDETLESNGKIERSTKTGDSRLTLADDLAGPLDLAVDATDVYFGETGDTTDDQTTGLYRVPKGGGTTTKLDDVLAAGVALTDDQIVIWGATEEYATGMFIRPKNGTGLGVLYAKEEEFVWSEPYIVDGHVYFLTATEDHDAIVRVPIAGGEPVTLRQGIFYMAELAVDECAVTFVDEEGALRRMLR